MSSSSRRPHVLIVSTAVDPATDSVVNALKAFNADITRIDTENYPYDLPGTIAFNWGPDRSTWDRGVGSVWYRRIRSPEPLPHVTTDIHEYCCQEAKAFVVGSVLASQLPTMSDPSRVWAAENKLFQLRLAQQIGFDIPATAVTNDPAAIRSLFRACSERMIVKPLRSGYVELAGEPRAVFTSQVLEEHLDQLDSAIPCPSIYQALLDKDCDVRITYVNGELFSAEIDSQTDPDAAVDWRRTSNPTLPHRKLQLPDKLSARICDFMNALGLTFGALDFVRTTAGDYVFLEVNPNGQWLWLEDQLGLPISASVAHWLVTRAQGA